jgi:hypothetical protein
MGKSDLTVENDKLRVEVFKEKIFGVVTVVINSYREMCYKKG